MTLRQRLAGRLPRGAMRVAWILLGGAAIYLMALFALIASDRLVSELLAITSVQTERVSFIVADGQRAAFYVEGMGVSAGDEQPGTACVTGRVVPMKGVTVSYGRVGNGPLEIGLDAAEDAPQGSPAAVLETGSGASQRLASPVVLIPRCGPPPLRLPIWGRVSIGNEFRSQATATPPEPSFLISGSVKVWGKTALDRALNEPASLYPVMDLALPVGSRLETWTEARGKQGGIWWGMAYPDPFKPALTVDVATEARQLALYRPNASGAEVIGVSPLTQIIKDPSLEDLHLVVAACLAVIGWLLEAGQRLKHERERRLAVPSGPENAPASSNSTF